MSNTKTLLILIYITLSSIILFRVSVHPLNYTTPDSIAYLEQSELIKQKWSDKSISVCEKLNVKEKFSIWPVGYPLTIATVSILTQTSSLYASKIVNLIFLGLLFILLYRWFGNKSWFLTLSLTSYGSLEVLSETWSETPFVFFVILLVYIVINEKKWNNIKLSSWLLISLTSLFIFRYVGLIYFGIIGLIMLKRLLKKEISLAISYGIPLLLSTILACLYFYHNMCTTGFITGMERTELGHQGIWTFLSLLFQGLFNEFSIARNFFFVGKPDILFLGMLMLQLIVMSLLFKHKKLLPSPLSHSTKTLFQFSAAYLIGMIILKAFIPIDEFDFRILAPFTIPLLIGVFSIISHQPFFDKTAKFVIAFMVVSLVVNLPKWYIVQEVKELVK